MVNKDSNLDKTFTALASPVRRQMLSEMAAGWISVSELSTPHAVSAPAISKHLRILEGAGLIERRKHGRVRYCRLKPEPVRAAVEFLGFYQEFWGAQFESLAKFLEEKEDNG